MDSGGEEYELGNELPNSSSSSEDNNTEIFSSPMVIEDVIEFIGFGFYQVLLFVASGVVWGSDAMEVLCLSFLSPELEKHWGSTDVEVTILVSVVFLGMLFGSLTFGHAADWIGRRPTYLISSGILIFAGALSASSVNMTMLIICRFFIGFGEGGAPVAFSMFAEFLPRKLRGRFLNMFEFWWTTGAIFESIIAWGVLSVIFGDSEYGWRILLVLSFIPLLIPLVMFFFVRESPRFHLSKGAIEKAEINLRKAARLNRKELPSEFALALPDSEKEETESGIKRRLKLYFNMYVLRNAFFLGIVWMCQSFLYYVLVQITPLLFTRIDNLNLNSDPYFMSIFSSISEVPGIILSLVLVDAFGRKLTESTLFCIASLSIFLINFVEYLRFFAGSLVLSIILVVLTSISRGAVMGAFCTSYTQTSEVFSTRIRGSMLGSMSALSRISGMLSPVLSYVVLSKFSYHVPVTLLSFICLLSAMSCLVTSETHNKPLQDD